MNTGEKVWSHPVGETPDAIKNHPRLDGVDVPNWRRDRLVYSDGHG